MSSSSYGYDAGTYREYKQCTRIFLDWIQNVVSKFSKKKNGNQFPNTSSGLRKQVELIVSGDGLKESFYKSDLWKNIWKILKNGERAIRLRMEVNEFFIKMEADENNVEANELHAYFIRVLEYCHELLKDWSSAVLRQGIEKTHQLSVGVNHKMSDINDKLDDMSLNLVAPEYDRVTKEEIERVKHNLRLHFACVLIDIRTGLEKVVEAWEDVKHERKSINSAIMVTYVAMKEVDVLDKQMQLMYVGYQTAWQFLTAVYTTQQNNESTHIFSNFIWAIRVLMGSPTLLLKDRFLFLANTHSEATFNDDIADWSCSCVTLFINNLFNQRYGEDSKTISLLEGLYRPFPLVSFFIDQFSAFCDTEDPSLTLVFAVMCWKEILSVLIDPNILLLTKTIYLMEKPWLDLMTNSRKLDENDEFCRRFNRQILERILENRRYSMVERLNLGWLTPNNPYLIGSVALSSRLLDLELNAEAEWHDWCYFRTFCYLYHACKSEGYMEAVLSATGLDSAPMEALFATFAPTVFRGTLPECGNYQMKYLMSMDVPLSVLTSKGDLESLIKFLPKKRSPGNRRYPSKIMSYLRDGDFSVFCEGKEEEAVYLSERLEMVSKQTEFEMYGNRCLSLDLFGYLRALAEGMDNIPQLHCIYEEIREMNPSYTRAEISERAILSVVLSIFDKPDDDRERDKFKHEALISVLAFLFAQFIGKDFLIYPASSKGVYSRCFGDVTLGNDISSQNIECAPEIFKKLMNRMELMPLEEERVTHKTVNSIIEQIRQCPSVLKMQLTNLAAHRFPSLLDYAFHHPQLTKYPQLRYWMLAMGGWITPDPSQSVRSQLQIAAMLDNSEAVWLLLHHDKSPILRTYQYPEDGNTALHYAAITFSKISGSRCLDFLDLEKAAYSIRNHEGKLFTDFVTDLERQKYYEYRTKTASPKDIENRAALLASRGEQLNHKCFLQESSMNVQVLADFLKRNREDKLIKNKRKGLKKQIVFYDLSEETIQSLIEKATKDKWERYVALKREGTGNQSSLININNV